MAMHLPEFQIDSSSDETLRIGTQKVVNLIRPNWRCSDTRFKTYTEGITNKLIGAWSELNRDDQILVRVYGEKTELFIDRNIETENIKFLYKHGCGPQLYAIFQNGLCYSYTPGIPLTPVAIREPKIWKAVGSQMAKLHNLKIDWKEAILFRKLKSFIQLLPESFSLDHKMRLEEAGIHKQYIEEEFKVLETVLNALNCPVVFCHNDILLNNVIWNADSETASFIDFEYGAANYQAFDIGNHFNEFAGVEVVDYNLYPNIAFQQEWLKNYLTHYYGYSKGCISFEEIEKWRDWVNKFSLASHLFWGTWAILQAIHSSIDFDFLGYSITRFQEYKKKKTEFLT